MATTTIWPDCKIKLQINSKSTPQKESIRKKERRKEAQRTRKLFRADQTSQGGKTRAGMRAWTDWDEHQSAGGIHLAVPPSETGSLCVSDLAIWKEVHASRLVHKLQGKALYNIALENITYERLQEHCVTV